jgi:hypothetical protein
MKETKTMSNAKRGGNTKDNARGSVTESPGITNGRARTERRLGSGNRRAGSAPALRAAARAAKHKTK